MPSAKAVVGANTRPASPDPPLSSNAQRKAAPKNPTTAAKDAATNDETVATTISPIVGRGCPLDALVLRCLMVLRISTAPMQKSTRIIKRSSIAISPVPKRGAAQCGFSRYSNPLTNSTLVKTAYCESLRRQRLLNRLAQNIEISGIITNALEDNSPVPIHDIRPRNSRIGEELVCRAIGIIGQRKRV